MEPDQPPVMRADQLPQMMSKDYERAHLADPTDTHYSLNWYSPSQHASDVIELFWVPVWQVPEGSVSSQSVLQYPGCVVVVSAQGAVLRGVSTGLATVDLTGTGWVVGAKLRPASCWLLTNRDVAEVTDTVVPLADIVAGADTLVGDVVNTMSEEPAAVTAQRQAAGFVERFLAQAIGPVDDEGALLNALIDSAIGGEPARTVAELTRQAHMSPRSLQRLFHRRLGVTPQWFVMRCRIQTGADALRQPGRALADVAVEVGYSDHAHFSRDFRNVTGYTPQEFATRWA